MKQLLHGTDANHQDLSNSDYIPRKNTSMQNSKITIVSGLSIDLSRIKAIRLNTSATLGPTNVLKVDLNLKYEYIFNPVKREFEKEPINDTISIEYVDYNDAQDALESLTEVWQEYSENQER